MLVLEIRERGGEEKEGTVLAKLFLKHGKVEGEGSEVLLNSLKAGVRGLDQKTYVPKDGIGFLKAVQESYSDSSHISARLLSPKK